MQLQGTRKHHLVAIHPDKATRKLTGLKKQQILVSTREH